MSSTRGRIAVRTAKRSRCTRRSTDPVPASNPQVTALYDAVIRTMRAIGHEAIRR